MSSKRRLLDFHFAVGAPGTRQSSAWHAWTHHSDVYIAHGNQGKMHKLSVHASSPYYFNGLTKEYASEHLNGRRDLMKWSRGTVPPLGQLCAAHVMWAVFPTDYLGPDRREYHGVHWIPTAPEGQAVQVDMLLTLESRATLEASFSHNGRRLEEYVKAAIRRLG
jgi:hypothetical protein